MFQICHSTMLRPLHSSPTDYEASPSVLHSPPCSHLQQNRPLLLEKHHFFQKSTGRAAFKRVGRAFMEVVKTAAPGYGIRDLSRGKHIIEKEVGRQLPCVFPDCPSRTPRVPGRSPCQHPSCGKCGAPMWLPTLYTADAGQAYEMINPNRIERAFQILFKTVQIKTGRKDPTISCMHSSKAKTRFGGWIRDRLNDRSVFYLSKIAHCMRGLVQLRWYRFGSLFLYQAQGSPSVARCREQFSNPF